MSEAFVEDWAGILGKHWVIVALSKLPLTWRQKKSALHEWCTEHDVEMTARDVEIVTGRPAGEV